MSSREASSRATRHYPTDWQVREGRCPNVFLLVKRHDHCRGRVELTYDKYVFCSVQGATYYSTQVSDECWLSGVVGYPF